MLQVVLASLYSVYSFTTKNTDGYGTGTCKNFRSVLVSALLQLSHDVYVTLHHKIFHHVKLLKQVGVNYVRALLRNLRERYFEHYVIENKKNSVHWQLTL